jgi:hypothetical protein
VGGARRVVVIGENTDKRVRPYAERIGASYYKPRSMIRDNWLANNRRWIRRQMNLGKDIVDIGPDEARRERSGPSVYYEMELQEILLRAYPRYRQDPQP